MRNRHADGNACVSREAGPLNFPVSSIALQPANDGKKNQADNGFVTKLDSGSEQVYRTYPGGSSGIADQSCFYCDNGDGIVRVAVD